MYTLENYVRAFEKMDFLKAFGNSLFVTCLSTLLVVIIASMTAYYFSRANNWFSKIFFALMIAADDNSFPGDHDSTCIYLWGKS